MRHHGAIGSGFRQQSGISGWVRRVRGWGHKDCRGGGGRFTLSFVDCRDESALGRSFGDI